MPAIFLPKRKSVRLKHYDYNQKGTYFVTICVYEHRHLLWNKIKGENMVSPVRLNKIGMMIDKWWQEIFEKYKDEIKLDEYIIMSNHIHGIIHIVGAIPCNRPNKSNIKNTYNGIGKYISWFKRMSTNEYIKNVKLNNWPPFNTRFWQRNYYEHVIRDEDDLLRVREYIINNPINWDKDEYNIEK
ncbi:MAG: transposase [Candidatus Zapsychrus exili]|nr:transposase [Candidatus Zapsychrus exili]